MYKRILFLLVLCCCFVRNTDAQELSFVDTVRAYNKARIVINANGMVALGGWGIANIVVGGTGYFLAKTDETKYFHEMNAAWGIVNTGIATYGYFHSLRQAKERLDMKKAYSNYKRDKKIYLINMGLDAVYMAAGAALVQYGNTDKVNPAMDKGFGKSILLQGAMLLAFDNIMFAAHLKYNSRWAVILDEMRFTGNGISFRL